MANKNILFIHGAWCSGASFNYLKSKALDVGTGVGKIHAFQYDCQVETLDRILLRAKKELNDLQKNGLKTIVVGHSMGGLLALYISHDNKSVSKTITISAPLSGIKIDNPLLKFYLRYIAPVLIKLQPNSSFIQELHKTNYNNKNIDILVTEGGFNFASLNEPSDGTVSVESQLSWTPRNANIIKINANHHEVLQTPQLVRRLELAILS